MAVDVVRLGLVGPGRWGMNYLRTASGMPGVRVSMACRRTAAPLEGFPDIPVTADLDELLGSCDAVVVATPPYAHEDPVLRALAAGLPVMLEKPAAMTLDSVSRMALAAEQAGLRILVNYVHLFSTAFQTLRAWTDRWERRQVTSLAGADGPVRDYPSLYDWGPHDLAMCLSLFGRSPDDMEALTVPSGRGEMHEMFLGFGESHATLRFGNGLAEKVRRFTVSAPEGTAEHDGVANSFTFNGKLFEWPEEKPLERALSSFRSYVVDRRPDWRLDPWLTLESSRLLGMAESLTSIRQVLYRSPR